LNISCGEVAGHEALLPTWQLDAFAGACGTPKFITSERTIPVPRASGAYRLARSKIERPFGWFLLPKIGRKRLGLNEPTGGTKP
jgi:hypothetical protein